MGTYLGWLFRCSDACPGPDCQPEIVQAGDRERVKFEAGLQVETMFLVDVLTKLIYIGAQAWWRLVDWLRCHDRRYARASVGLYRGQSGKRPYRASLELPE